MNLYFLVEGRRTEASLYPAWLSHLLPLHTRVASPLDATANHYFLISGAGYPRLLDVTLPNAVADTVDSGQFDYLVICLDADEVTPEERRQEVLDRLQPIDRTLPGRTIPRVIVQTRCIESWLLGNRTMFPRNPQCPELREYIRRYDVSSLCPERMGGHEDFITAAAYHEDYLTRVFTERKLRYTKQHPGEARSEPFLARLVERSAVEDHLQTFRAFFDLCQTVRQHTPAYHTPPTPE